MPFSPSLGAADLYCSGKRELEQWQQLTNRAVIQADDIDGACMHVVYTA